VLVLAEAPGVECGCGGVGIGIGICRRGLKKAGEENVEEKTTNKIR